MAGPTSIHLWAYRVGFGDCYLLRFAYPKRNRHVLIDFGSTAAAARLGSQMQEVAEHIAKTCGGKLDVIVATHRHRDHISGFAGETWEVIRQLSPELVVLPWTEHPEAEVDAQVAPSGSTQGIGPRSASHVRSLSRMHEVAAALLEELGAEAAHADAGEEPGREEAEPGEDAGALEPSAEDAPAEDVRFAASPRGSRLRRQLAFLGEDNLKNAEALRNLLSLPCEFLAFDSRSPGLARLLPGVKTRVLGPPTLAQSKAISEQRSRDPDEFWHVMARATARAARPGTSLFPDVQPLPLGSQPVETAWFIKRMDAARGQQMLEVVRSLDSVLNNTSLILLFEACGKKLLFPGDAQIENWSHALSHKRVLTLLEDVDVYKVGHHGSLNATPKTLWKAFSKKGAAGRRGRLKTFMSTRPGKHGSAGRGTEVPRGKLVNELAAHSDLFSTHTLTARADFVREFQLAP